MMMFQLLTLTRLHRLIMPRTRDCLVDFGSHFVLTYLMQFRCQRRSLFCIHRDLFAATPRKADYAWTTLARIMSFAKDRGTIATNPCEKGGRLYAADRTDKFWGESEIAALLCGRIARDQTGAGAGALDWPAARRPIAAAVVVV